jgi:hypothetical protein
MLEIIPRLRLNGQTRQTVSGNDALGLTRLRQGTRTMRSSDPRFAEGGFAPPLQPPISSAVAVKPILLEIARYGETAR